MQLGKWHKLTTKSVCHGKGVVVRVLALPGPFWVRRRREGKALESSGCARQPREEPQPEDLGPPAVPWDSCPSGVEGEPRTMAAVHDLEMESMNLNMGREMKEELEEEEKMRENGGGKDRAKSRKVHRIVSKWMLPEKARGTYLERANCFPPPVFIISISLAELAVFIYYAVWKPQKQWITLDTGILESPFIYSPEKREEAWRFISYMLVHAGVQHILGNLCMQLVLGIPLEMVHKGLRVGLVYLAGVIAGSLASSIFDPLRYLVGASGGVYALMGGYFMNVLVNFQEMIPAFGIFRLLVIILIIVLDMGFALYRRFFVPEDGSPVSFAAHVAGGFAGMSIGYTVFSCFDKALLKDPRFWIAIAAYLACVLFAVFFNIFLSPAN
ncbi:rhomboid-related protein 2 isoform X1 [Papio anubis]|uniref:rhomboid-related protein 2 isoform X1 n=1 Tax=Papio anubis TaxID=9555 RepID=UPI0012ADCDF5|nr:rhomboid-related protein 2 isoform X1 [Papio anubis]